MKKVETINAPAAVGPYSQAIIDIETNIAYLSGQIALDPSITDIEENKKKLHTLTIEEQTHQVMKNLKAVLKEVGSDFDHVLKCDIFVKNINDFGIVNQVYSNYFTSDIKPARATIAVAALPLGAKIEISCIAKVYKLN
jgi:2-iminobutanoate/2-iminopropanoate deaminase